MCTRWLVVFSLAIGIATSAFVAPAAAQTQWVPSDPRNDQLAAEMWRGVRQGMVTSYGTTCRARAGALPDPRASAGVMRFCQCLEGYLATQSLLTIREIGQKFEAFAHTAPFQTCLRQAL